MFSANENLKGFDMEKYIIDGGCKLEGVVKIQSSKNAVLPLLAASLLTKEEVIIKNCPKITDVFNMIKILEILGCKVEFQEKNLKIDSAKAKGCKIPEDLSKTMRSSIFLLGSIIGRFKYAAISYPGGCNIGSRPIDLHIEGLKSLNIKIIEDKDVIECIAEKLKGASFCLRVPSVGATENIMLAAVLAEGKTTIYNSALEPEIVELQNFINAMGGCVKGAGSPVIEILGVKELKKVEFSPVSDRIVAGTMLILGALCGSELELNNCIPKHLISLITKLRETACHIECINDKIYIQAPNKLLSVKTIETAPYPQFPTDLQAQFLALAAVTKGETRITETIFETRFNHVAELVKMGAKIEVLNRTAVVKGVKNLKGAKLQAKDLRGGAALVLAGLKANGTTIVEDIYHIDRGYEDFEGILTSLGAKIKRV